MDVFHLNWLTATTATTITLCNTHSIYQWALQDKIVFIYLSIFLKLAFSHPTFTERQLEEYPFE